MKNVRFLLFLTIFFGVVSSIFGIILAYIFNDVAVQAHRFGFLFAFIFLLITSMSAVYIPLFTKRASKLAWIPNTTGILILISFILIVLNVILGFGKYYLVQPAFGLVLFSGLLYCAYSASFFMKKGWRDIEVPEDLADKEPKRFEELDWWAARFTIASPIFFVFAALGFLLYTMKRLAMGSIFTSYHFLAFGFAGMMIYGVSYHILPRLSGKIPPVGLVAINLLASFLGMVLVGINGYTSIHIVIYYVGTILIALGGFIFVIAILPSISSLKTCWGIKAGFYIAFIYHLTGLIAGVLEITTSWTQYFGLLKLLHIHGEMAGWILLTIVSFAFLNWHRLFRVKALPEPFMTITILLIAVSNLIFIISPAIHNLERILRLSGASGIFAGFILFVIGSASLVQRGK